MAKYFKGADVVMLSDALRIMYEVVACDMMLEVIKEDNQSKELSSKELLEECYCDCDSQTIVFTVHPLPDICNHCCKAIKGGSDG